MLIFKGVFMYLIPQNAGEFWTAISAIATFLAVIIALFPIFSNHLLQNKKNYITRFALFNDLRNIHESYFGKILHYIQTCRKNDNYKIPDDDHKYFSSIENLQNEMTNLTDYEKKLILNIISIYKETMYRKDNVGNYFISLENIKKIELYAKKSIELLLINMKLDKKNNNTCNNNFRIKSYDKIKYYLNLNGIKIPTIEEMNTELLEVGNFNLKE